MTNLSHRYQSSEFISKRTDAVMARIEEMEGKRDAVPAGNLTDPVIARGFREIIQELAEKSQEPLFIKGRQK